MGYGRFRMRISKQSVLSFREKIGYKSRVKSISNLLQDVLHTVAVLSDIPRALSATGRAS